MNAHDVEELREFLGRQFRIGSAILLTGAGFTDGIRNVRGEALPFGYDLARRIWTYCFPRDVDDESSLDTLFPILMKTKGREGIEWLRRELTVDPQSVPDHIQAWFRLPWRRIYTLNIDTLGHAVQQKWALPISLEVCSPRSAAPRIGEASTRDGRRRIEYVQLHGRLDDLPDGVTMSVLQYAREIPGANKWLPALTDDLVRHPCVFVGTRLNEPDIWQHMELRGQRHGQDERDHRPRSFLITDKDPGKGKKELLKTYATTWVRATAEEFSKEVLAYLPAAVPLVAHGVDPVTEASVQHQIATSPPRAPDTAYLLGHEPSWNDVRSGLCASRKVMDTLEAICRAAIAGRKPAIVSLVGTAGSGKSSVAMNVLSRLNASGVPCHYVGSERGYYWEDLWRDLERNPTGVLCIDDAHRLRRDGLMTLLRTQATHPCAGVIVLVFASHRIDLLLTDEEQRSMGVQELLVPHLEDADIAEVLRVLESHALLGELTSMPHGRRVAIFKGLLGRQLLAAMIYATSGQELAEKVISEYTSLLPAEQRIYGALCVATARGIGLLEDEIFLAVGPVTNTSVDALRRLVRRGLVVARPHGRLALRHKIIASELERFLRREARLAGVLSDVLPMLGVRAKHRDPTALRLLSALLNHNYLYERLGLEGTRELLTEIEPSLAVDHHYWLQRAEVELEWGSGNDALRYLQVAQGLAPDDWLIRVGRAHAMLRLACEAPHDVEASDRVEAAVGEILAVIDLHGQKGQHPFHILGSWASKWTLASRWEPERKRKLLQDVLEVLEVGIRLHPAADELRVAREGAKRALMMTAVRSGGAPPPGPGAAS